MLRFSKQMQALAPKQKAIQEKYKNDPVKMREETTKLMREGHVDYGAAMKGCLPPLLQTPIWIALYAMIFFTFELRHEAAFFGVVQWITGGRWSFLADLAEPDNFVSFRDAFGWDGFSIPLLSSLMGPIQGLNILPLLLGVVFYIQQKYMTPPSTGQMTPEQEQQQKMMKVMTVVMFPVFMYNAPAALALYFMVNSSLGILESKWIRSHADQLEKKREAHIAAGGAPHDRLHREKAKAASKPGFFARLQAEVERRQKQMEAQKRQATKKNRKP
jgi:YidC/Oxa1 family membrane protein insertase